MKDRQSPVRKLTALGEFCFVLVTCSWFGIASSISSIATHSWDIAARVLVTDTSILIVVILELLALGAMWWIGRARGWSLDAGGVQPSWKLTAMGVLLCLLTLLLAFSVTALVNLVAPGTLHRRTHPEVSLLFFVLLVAINPVYEEMIETGYFVQSLRRYGGWIAVCASAAFRAFLHAYQGINTLLLIFPIGLIFGFVYWKWRRLWPLFVAHGLLDLYALFPGVRAL